MEATVIENPLVSLVGKLKEQQVAKKDIVVPAGYISYSGVDGLLTVGEDSMKVSDYAHQQIADKLEIPRSYYKKMQSGYPELLEQNVNMWLSRKEKTKYLLRTFNYADKDNICRALLSDRYNILDNMDVLVCALEAIKETGVHVEIVKAEVSDTNMYIHVVAPEIHVEATDLLDGYLQNRDSAITGRGIISGMVISNSEVGNGTFEISARAQILQCKNGMHDRNAKFRKVHLGGKLEEGIQWSQNTKNKNYELIMSQVSDSVKVYLSKDYLGQLTDKLRKAKEVEVEHPAGMIERVSNELLIPETHRNSILNYYMKDGDLSGLGIIHAVTRTTQHMGVDDQFEIESGIFNLIPKLKQFDKPVSKN